MLKAVSISMSNNFHNHLFLSFSLPQLEAISLLQVVDNSLKQKSDQTTTDPYETTSSEQLRETTSSLGALREVEQLESNFQSIQDGFLKAIKNDKDRADYVQRMKVRSW